MTTMGDRRRRSTGSSAQRRLSLTSLSSSRTGVRVVCRVRPLNEKEKRTGLPVAAHVLPCDVAVPTTSDDEKSGSEEQRKQNSTSLTIKMTDGARHTFSFDSVFDVNSTQMDVYAMAAKPIIDDVTQGYNGTVFAYGQTGAGKTFTMEGSFGREKYDRAEYEAVDAGSRSGWGVIPQAVQDIFEYTKTAEEHLEFEVRVSHMEIYKEQLRDLLQMDGGASSKLQIRDDPARGIFIQGLKEVYVASPDELLGVMREGSSNRAMSATNMNEQSSRSHSIFQIVLQQRNTQDGIVKTGKLNLVDLAGSEMVKKTRASGERLEEAKTINKSLSALGNVINSLTDGKSTHIPYRDSKLTRVLQESLGGNAKTALIICCSPSAYNENETLSTLRFGKRAKQVKNAAKVNKERSPEEMRKYILLLEKRLETQSRARPLGRKYHSMAPAAADAHLTSFRQTMELDEAKKKIKELESTTERLKDELRVARAPPAPLSPRSIVTNVLDEAVKRVSETDQVDSLRKENIDLKEKYEAMQREVSVLENLVCKLQMNAADSTATAPAIDSKVDEEDEIHVFGVDDNDDNSSTASFTLKADVFTPSPLAPRSPGSATVWGRFKKRIRGLGITSSGSTPGSTTVLQQRFLSAAQDLDRDTMLDCLDDGVRASCTDFDGSNAIHKVLLTRRDDAMAEGDMLAMVSWITDDLGVSLDLKTRDGRTAFHYGCRKGRVFVVEWLGERGADFLVCDRFGLNALHHAVLGKHPKIVSYLLAKGADRTHRDRNGKTPLDLCSGSSDECKEMRLLLTPALKNVATERNVASPSSIVQWIS